MRRGPSDLRVMSPLSASGPAAIPPLSPCYAGISTPQASAWVRTSTRPSAAAVLPRCHETVEDSRVRSILMLRTNQGTMTTTTKHSVASAPPSTPPILSDMLSTPSARRFDLRLAISGSNTSGTIDCTAAKFAERSTHDIGSRTLTHDHGGSRHTVG
jgi:hypothetical protein